MRTYGRVSNPDGSKTWVVVQTAPDGSNDYVWLTTLCQVLLLNLGDSPFYANFGIPAKPSVVQQVQPDYYVARTQQQFAKYFASLIVAKRAAQANPTYDIAVTTNQGVKMAASVPI